MKVLGYLIMLMGLIGCSYTKPSKSINDLKLGHIRSLYQKLPKIKFPFEYDVSNSNGIGQIYSNQDLDSLIFEKDIRVNIAGVIQDTANFFGFIYFSPGDELIPILVTFDKTGGLIEKIQIAKGCASDCGYDCHSTVSINKDYKIVSKLNETIAECDNVGPIDSTKIYRETVEISQLDKLGKIKLIEKKTDEKK
jgi:hypothetical protein